MRKINNKGLNLIKDFEKLRLDCYNDGYGFKTIGWGHLVSKNEPWRIGDKITVVKADELLVKDLSKAVADVNRFVKVPLSQNQFDACVSLSFNLGSISAAKTLLARLNAKDYDGAGKAFGRYIFAAGQRSRGLVRRRKAEQMLFLSPDK